MSSVFEQSATSLLADLAAGRTTSVALINAHISRIEAVNPKLNAMVANRFAEARLEAAQADAQRARGGDLPPLLGLPCTIKEFLGVTGMPSTAGVVALKDRVATEDATVVRRVRAAGAIVLGVTNAPEGGLWLETYNRVYGRTLNPWDTSRSPGGSSGGEAALIAAGASPFGLGSDMGGSVRIPAALCGIWGHKPTGGWVPTDGHFPAPEGDARPYLAVGPMTRDADDLELLMSVLTGGNFKAPPVDPRGLVVRTVVDPGIRVHPAMANAVSRAAAYLASQGADVQPIELPELKRAFRIWAAMAAAASPKPFEDLFATEKGPIRLRRAAAGWAVRRSPHTLPVLVTMALERLLARFASDGPELIAAGLALRGKIESALGSDGVLLMPGFARPAEPHRLAYLRPLDVGLTAFANVLELPGTHAPIGMDSRGLPVGVQIFGSRGADARTIGVARTLQAGGFRWRRALSSIP